MDVTESTAAKRELSQIYRSRVSESFTRAHRCLTYARIARQRGDTHGLARWLWCIRALRLAAVCWRQRAQSIALVCLVLLSIGCAQQPAVKQPPAVSVPVTLIRAVCEKAHLGQGSGHWDGHAQLMWSTDGSDVVAIDCTFTAFADGLTTIIVRVDISDERAQGLRDFLASRGAR